MTAEELLEDATAHFENTFEHVQMGNTSVCFYVNGVRHEYVEVCSGGVRKDEGAKIAYFDTAAEAIQSWQAALQPFKGKKLYWRRKPEIDFDRNEKSFETGGPNPTFGK